MINKALIRAYQKARYKVRAEDLCRWPAQQDAVVHLSLSPPIKLAVSWSGGKDSGLVFWKLMKMALMSRSFLVSYFKKRTKIQQAQKNNVDARAYLFIEKAFLAPK